jgi:hypothetical protein
MKVSGARSSGIGIVFRNTRTIIVTTAADEAMIDVRKK